MVRFDSVAFSYRPGATPDAEVFRDVSFDLAEGAFRWLLGPSGSGKTTLLRLMNLSLRPRRGEVIVLGVASGARRKILPRLRRQIGVICQDLPLLAHLSVFDNVALPLRLTGRPEGQLRADVMEMLRWLGLAEHLVARPDDLSGGERQRAKVARAVIARPRLVLADEPTAGLDAGDAERVVHLLQSLNRLGSTVIIATHDEAMVERYPGVALRLDQGTLEEAA